MATTRVLYGHTPGVMFWFGFMKRPLGL